eukprot:Gb_18312 [translate_table: standard]
MYASSILSSLGAALQALPSPLFHVRFNSSVHPTTTHPLLDAFENPVSSQLHKLQVSDQSSYLTAEWFHQALDVSLSTHYHVEKLFPHIREAHLHENCNWVNQHLDDTVKLLDVCNVLRESISDIKQYMTSLQMAIHCLEGKGNLNAGQLVRARNSLGNCLEAMRKEESHNNAQVRRRSKLEKCSFMLRRMAENLSTHTVADSCTDGQFLDAMNGSKATTVFVCGALVAALSFKSKRSLPVSKVGQSVWSFSLLNLHHKVKEEVKRRRMKAARALLQELDMVDCAARRLHHLLTKYSNCKEIPLLTDQSVQELNQSVQNMKRWTGELEQGMAPFEKQINELFGALIKSRMALLDVFSYSN